MLPSIHCMSNLKKKWDTYMGGYERESDQGTIKGAIVSRGQSCICEGWRSKMQVRTTVCDAVYWKSSIRKAWVTLSQLK